LLTVHTDESDGADTDLLVDTGPAVWRGLTVELSDLSPSLQK
jgi:hypothetical protein